MSNTSMNQNDVNMLVYEAYDSGFKNYTPRHPYIFKVLSPQRKDEKISITSSGGDIPNVAEGAPFPQVDISEAGSLTASQKVFKEAIPVTTLLQRFDNYGSVIQEASKQGYRANLTMDRQCANLISNGFSGASTPSVTWDGLSLFNSAHLIGSTAFTQSNLISGQLTDSSLNTAVTNLRRMKDHNNQEMALLPRTLLVAPEFAKKAFELTASPGAPESANRNSNYWNTQGLQVVVWELLSTSNSGGTWALFADMVFTRLNFFVSIMPRLEYVRVPSTGNYEYQTEFACVPSAADFIGTQGSNGS